MTLDEKVIEFQKTGEFEIGKDILNESSKIAKNIIGRYFYEFGYYDDLLTEANDATLLAIQSFKPGLAQFNTFCAKCITNNLNNFVRKIKVRNNLRMNPKPQSYCIVETIDFKNSLRKLKEKEFKAIFLGNQTQWSEYFSKKRLKKEIYA